MLSYEIKMSLVLSTIGILLVAHGIRRNSQFEIACGMIPIMVVILYLAMESAAFAERMVDSL